MKKDNNRIKKFGTTLLVFIILLMFYFLLFDKDSKNNSHGSRTMMDLTCDKCNILIVTIDTLRADHLGVYGYNRNTTPNIDRLAENSIVFVNHYTTMPSTQPAHYSMFSTLPPYLSGYFSNRAPINSNFNPKGFLLAKILNKENYFTGAITSSLNFHNSSKFEAGFDTYYWPGKNYRNNPPNENDAAITANMVIDWINLSYNKKFFLWAHFYDPHDPYQPPKEFDIFEIDNNSQEREEVLLSISKYDGEIYYVDFQIGRIINYLNSENLLNKTIIIITSDHGQGLFQHLDYSGNGDLLYEEQLKIPMIIYVKGVKDRFSMVTQNTQLSPTVLKILNLTNAYSDVPTLFENRNPIMYYESDICINQQVNNCYPNNSITGKSISIRHKNLKYIYTPTKKGFYEEIYDLSNDPEEIENIAKYKLEKYFFRIALYMVKNKIYSRNIPDKNVYNAQNYQMLKSLGYIE